MPFSFSFLFSSHYVATRGSRGKQDVQNNGEKISGNTVRNGSVFFFFFFMNEAKERFGLLIRPGLFILMAIFPGLLRKHAGRPNQQRSLELNVHYININSTFPLKKNFCATAPIQEDQNHLQRALWRSVRIRGSSYERWRFSAFSPCKFLLHAH